MTLYPEALTLHHERYVVGHVCVLGCRHSPACGGYPSHLFNP
jgi:hypothetical protein